MKTINTKIMKKGIVVLAAIIMAACAKPVQDKNIEELLVKRDSLLTERLEIDKELNSIDQQIALLDSSSAGKDQSILKQITMQKNRLAVTELKIKKLEAELGSDNIESYTAVAIKEMLPEEFVHSIIVFGKVEADDYALISPEMPGRIQSIHVQEGQSVANGTLLVSLNTDAVDKQIEGVKSSLELATTTFEKQDTLWKQGIGSEIQYLGAKNNKESLEAQLEALKAQKRMAQIRAPFDGIVDKIYLKQGELASSMMPVVEFVNLDKLSIKADISENFIDKIKVGQKVDISFSSIPDMVMSAPIKRKSKVINSSSRTFEIELSFNNPGKRIKPNMVSTINIEDYKTPNAMVVPSLVIMKDITGSYVYLVKEKEGKNVVRKQYITTGKAYQDNSEVIKGIAQGDKVVVKGYHMVSAGVPVKVINEK